MDQAETILHRLLRGSSYAGLSGMSPRAVVGRLVILRPLLAVDQPLLPAYLIGLGQSWQTDASNESNQYLRNRLRKLLKGRPCLQSAMLELGGACAELRDWSRAAAPVLGEQFECALLSRLPAILAHESARRWLIERRVRINDVSAEVVQRLVEMSRDAASPPRQDFPGPLRVRRRRGIISVD
jgi:tRNA(Ile)-lysidine synthase